MSELAIEGFGLGLHIARLVVEALDGRIPAESEFRKGSDLQLHSAPCVASHAARVAICSAEWNLTLSTSLALLPTPVGGLLGRCL